ncbi:NAD(P)H-binding protein [Flavobacterium sp. FlaQc-48]|uniref:NAD(P)H-binding protein n=1 Tax=Flavobacterium sp. FlaQc-48 TaxID=3374181 RepID=UPI003757E839
MKVLIVGASGSTGKLLTEHLLSLGHSVRIMVRVTSTIPNAWDHNDMINILRVGAIEDISTRELAKQLKECQAVVSCLGHNPTFRGIYGKPRQLVSDTVELLCRSIIENYPEKPMKFVLMNTAGNRNPDLNEPISFMEKIAIGLIRLLLPPQSDNEKAAEYLRVKIGQKNPFIEWVVVRPDSLKNHVKGSAYSLHRSPVRSALFDSGQTSRINVAHFMSQLIINDTLWNSWKGQMPIIYNHEESEKKFSGA